MNTAFDLSIGRTPFELDDSVEYVGAEKKRVRKGKRKMEDLLKHLDVFDADVLEPVLNATHQIRYVLMKTAPVA